MKKIDKIPAILDAINLIDLAYFYGYTKEDRSKRSVNWIKLVNPASQDKILIYRGESPFRFKNCAPHLDQDRGNVINFVINRESSMVIPCPNPTKEQRARALKLLKQKIGHEYQTPEAFQAIKKSGGTASKTQHYNLERYLNIKPFDPKHISYLTDHRKISTETIHRFKNRIKLSEYIAESGKVFTNIAFPKYDPDTGMIKGYSVYYKNYGDKPDTKRIYGASDNLWCGSAHSEIVEIAIGESELDCLSHFELSRTQDLSANENTLYISTNGGLSDTKIAFIVSKLYQYFPEEPPRITLINDNDAQGYLYDLSLTIALNNKYTAKDSGKQPFFETLPQQHEFKIILHNFPYDQTLHKKLREHARLITQKTRLSEYRQLKPLNFSMLKDKVVLEFPVHRAKNPRNEQERKLERIPLYITRILQEHFSPNLQMKTPKPNLKNDWNDVLKHYKKTHPDQKKNDIKNRIKR